MSQFFRVAHPLFGEYSTRTPAAFDAEVVDKPAVNADGRPRAAKPKVSVAAKAPEKRKTPTGGEPAKNPEEGSK